MIPNDYIKSKKIVSQPPRNLRNCLVAPEVWDFDKAGVEPQRWCHVCCNMGCFMVVVPSEMIPILPNSSAVFSEKLIWLWISSHLRLVVACSFEFHQIPMNDLNQIRTLEGSTHNSQYWENDEPEDLVLSYFRIFGETHIEIKAKLPLNYHFNTTTFGSRYDTPGLVRLPFIWSSTHVVYFNEFLWGSLKSVFSGYSPCLYKFQSGYIHIQEIMCPPNSKRTNKLHFQTLKLDEMHNVFWKTVFACSMLSGWWFQTFFIFYNIWDNPSHWLMFFKTVKTTNQLWMFLDRKPLSFPFRTTHCLESDQMGNPKKSSVFHRKTHEIPIIKT